MTVTQFLLMLILILVILGGAYLLYRSYKSSKTTEHEHGEYDKNGIPIIPRHERNIVDAPDFDDTLAGETIITPDHDKLKSVVEDDLLDTDDVNYTNNDYLNNSSDNSVTDYNSADDLDKPAQYVDDERLYSEPLYSDEVEPNSGFDDGDDSDLNEHQADASSYSIATDDNAKETDLFSSLASATENILPPVDIAEEPEFNDNSPVLDQHLLAEADQDQNSPLNHAEENVNITLIPKNRFETIDGATIREIVTQYGLKYGAMNMFHRYENKDGTGILWFSMMGMTVDGVAPFDLNNLTSTEYNGLVLFLSLPHPKAVQGFDSMMSVAGLIARQLDTQILDEANRPLTREHKMQLRQAVQDFQ